MFSFVSLTSVCSSMPSGPATALRPKSRRRTQGIVDAVAEAHHELHAHGDAAAVAAHHAHHVDVVLVVARAA